jgi:hypothetical protein
MKPPAEWKQARELAADPNSYGEDGRMLPEVIDRIEQLAERMGGENVHSLHPRLVHEP